MRLPALLSTTLLCVVLALLAGPAVASANYDDANVSIYATDADLDGAGDIEAAIENGTASTPQNVLIGDSLIVAIDSGRLAGEIDEANGSTPTERFFDVLDGDPELRIGQINYFQRYGPKVFQLGPANTTVYRSGDRTYAVIDTGTVDVDRPDSNRSVDAVLQ